MGRVGHHHIGLGDRRQHALTRHGPLALLDLALDVRVAFGFLVFLLGFGGRHHQILAMTPDLQRTVHGCSHDHHRTGPQQSEAQIFTGTGQRERQRHPGIGCKARQAVRHDPEPHCADRQCDTRQLAQLDQRLDRKDPAQALHGVELAQIRGDWLEGQHQAADADRGQTGGCNRSDEYGQYSHQSLPRLVGSSL